MYKTYHHIRRTYLSNSIYFVTTNVRGWYPYFLKRSLAEILIGNIWWSHKEQQFTIYAFVVMPDHLHRLVQPQRTNISGVMHSIKNNSSRDIRRFLERYTNTPMYSGAAGSSAMKRITFQWQKSFLDHIIIDERDFHNHIEYTRYNPVKAGLVENPENYSFLHVDHDAINQAMGF